MDATMQFLVHNLISKKNTNTPWYPMNAHAKLISTIRAPHGGYCPANFIKIDPFMDATTQLFPLKFMPYWWSFPTMSLQIQAIQPFMDANSSLRLSNLIPHRCYYATNSHRIDAPAVFICKLIPATLVHGWMKATLFRGVWFFDSLTGPCWLCWPIGGVLIRCLY